MDLSRLYSAVILLGDIMIRCKQRWVTSSCLVVFMAGCAVFSGTDRDKMSASQLYEQAKSSLDRGSYQTAVELYETLEARFPFGRFARQAQLEAAYAYYKFGEPDSAIAAAERFIKLHPHDRNVAYAYYLKGLANFERGHGFFDRLVGKGRDDVDPQPMRQAFRDFETLLAEYPDSRYAEDTVQRMRFLRNELAEYELKVAQYYMRRGAYLAAANRCKYVVQHFSTSPAVISALELLVQAYRELKLETLADDAARVLDANRLNTLSPRS